MDRISGNHYLRRPLGGRLRTYRPAQSRAAPAERLNRIRKAMLRGELVVNSFNRWQLLKNRTAGVHWTFTEPGSTNDTASMERAVARREAGDISIAMTDERRAEETATRINAGLERSDLLFALRDWSQAPGECPAFARMIHGARQRGITVHIVAAFGTRHGDGDKFLAEARRRWRLSRDPMLGPAPHTSRIERDFGECLKDAGINPIPQMPVAGYYLDFAVLGTSGGLPVRLDVEVDGRFWHEELPGHLRPQDEKRDRALRRLGWRPVRFWADEIKRDQDACLTRVLADMASPEPRTRKTSAWEMKDDPIEI